MMTSEVKDLSAAMYRTLYSLNMRHKGRMADILTEFHYKPGARVYILQDTTRVTAWAMVHKQRYRSAGVEKERYTADFYVRKSERRKGLGSSLAKVVKKDYPFVTVNRHDYESESFFKKLEMGRNGQRRTQNSIGRNERDVRPEHNPQISG